MTAAGIRLRFAGVNRVVSLRELTGRNEFDVSGAGTTCAIDLLEALLEKPSAPENFIQSRTGIPACHSLGQNFTQLDIGTQDRQECLSYTEPIRAIDLTAADRDRMLAAVYAHAFGDRIESTVTCAGCAQPFDLHFSLCRLIESVNDRTLVGEWKALGNGVVEGPDGKRIRLPTGRDELAVAGLSIGEAESFLWNRCSEGTDWSGDRSAFENLLEDVAPLLSLELLARCVECNFEHQIQFDIQSYLLGAIVAERRRLLAEINSLAAAYSWSLDEILSLTRSDRRQLVQLIENEYVA